ncbi:alpha/beta hydrolase [Parahaliea aestuarii]|uniref:alpha/beta hydrolase n=1 Tax=Parahaliea aestuarii TaxID=1852021 RepID=UPI001650697F|nr:alpha/beta hydrolase [Parahaliea aestuarii]
MAPPLLGDYLRYYHLDALAGSRASHCIGTVTSGDFSLAAQRWLHPGASHNLLLLHGYFDHAGLFGKLVDYGLSRNCNVLVFDLPGHGLSSGRPAAIDTFDHYGDSIAAVLAAVDLPELPLWVMAQSTGAAALMNFSRRHAWPFTETVLLAPLLRPAKWGQVRLAHSLLHHFVDSVPRRFAVNSSDAEFLAFLQEDPLQPRRIPVNWVGALKDWLARLPLQDLGVGPALIVQGDRDTTVDWQYNLPQMSRLFPGCHIQQVPGAGHHLANESAELRQRYLRAVDRYVGLAPA